MSTTDTKFIIVETLSYDGESVFKVTAKSRQFDTYEEAVGEFEALEEKYKEDWNNLVDFDNHGIVFYEGNGEIHNLLIMEV